MKTVGVMPLPAKYALQTTLDVVPVTEAEPGGFTGPVSRMIDSPVMLPISPVAIVAVSPASTTTVPLSGVLSFTRAPPAEKISTRKRADLDFSIFVQVKAVSRPDPDMTPLTVKALLHLPEELEDEHEERDESETLEELDELDELASSAPFFAKAGDATARLPTNKMANSLCLDVFIVFTFVELPA